MWRPQRPSQRTLEVVFFLASLFGLIVLTALASSCATMEAIEELPVGYWESTRNLVLAVLQDVWDLVTIFV